MEDKLKIPQLDDLQLQLLLIEISKIINELSNRIQKLEEIMLEQSKDEFIIKIYYLNSL